MNRPATSLAQVLLLSASCILRGQEPPSSTTGLRHRFGAQIVSSRFFGEFGRTDHHGPWFGTGFGLHDLIRLSGDRAILLRWDYTYHRIPERSVRAASGSLIVDGVARRGTIEAWSINNLGADYRWYRKGSGGTGPYLGAGVGISILGQDNVDFDTRQSLAHGGSLSAHLNLVIGRSFTAHLEGELRASLAQYGIWTAPSASAVIYIRF